VQRLFERALAHDSAGLTVLTNNTEVEQWLLSLAVREPLLVQAASQGPTVQSAVRRGDTLFLAYRLPKAPSSEIITLGLVRSQGTWRIYSAGLPDRQ
jgi:hypothetical protein